jgi:2-phosphosulfolactate phosphatase
MPHELNVYVLPKYVSPEEMAGAAVAVIDVLRSTTTIAFALAAGAAEVIPCAEVNDARTVAAMFDRKDVILGGERHGVALDGFDLGNSPKDYTPGRVAGKTVVITTTNGTLAMKHACLAAEIYIASFVNASAVVRRLQHAEQIHVLCSGTDGQPSEDDTLLAGVIVDRLQRSSAEAYRLNAQAIAARELWLKCFAVPQAPRVETIEPRQLADVLRKTLGAKNLLELGFGEDIAAAAEIDRLDIVPQLTFGHGDGPGRIRC